MVLLEQTDRRLPFSTCFFHSAGHLWGGRESSTNQRHILQIELITIIQFFIRDIAEIWIKSYVDFLFQSPSTSFNTAQQLALIDFWLILFFSCKKEGKQQKRTKKGFPKLLVWFVWFFGGVCKQKRNTCIKANASQQYISPISAKRTQIFCCQFTNKLIATCMYHISIKFSSNNINQYIKCMCVLSYSHIGVW